MKKNAKIFMAMSLALLAGSLIVTGCPTEVKTEIEYVDKVGGIIPFDKVVASEAGLLAALSNPGYTYIGVTGGITLTSDLEIPAGKNVYLYAQVDTGSSTLTVSGRLAAAVDGTLAASSSGQVTVAETGSISVEQGGTLLIDNADSVISGEATALGTSKAAIAGGTLAYADSFSNAAAIQTALAYLSSGVLKVEGSSLKPSDVANGVTVSPAKRLSIDLGGTTETETTLTIPAGLAITTSAGLSAVEVTVSGGLTASSNPSSLAIKAGATVNGITFPHEAEAGVLTISGANEVTIVASKTYSLSGNLDVGSGSTLKIAGTLAPGGDYISGAGLIATTGA